MKKLKCFTLTRVDPELWKEFKAACAHYDLYIRDVFIKHIHNIVSDYKRQMLFKPASIVKPKKGDKKK